MPSLTAGDIATRCMNARQTSTGWQACCPAHEDSHASLSIGEGNKGVVLHCHAGCSYQAILEALSVSPSELRNGNGHTTTTGPRRIVATYDYVDLDGHLLFQAIRYEPKEFRQRRPNPEYPEEWIYNLKGVTPILYNLSAVTTVDRVFVVEGEKDVETLRRYGLVGTTAPMGAGKWRPHYSEYLRGKDVVLLPDNDEPGRKHMAQVAKSLQGIASNCWQVQLPVPEKGDVTDWFAAGYGVEELECLIVSARHATAQPVASVAPKKEKQYSPEGMRNLRYHEPNAHFDDDDVESWRAGLSIDKEGRPRETVGNTAMLLAQLPEAQELWWDVFAMQNMWGEQALTDDDVITFALLLQKRFEIPINRLGNLHRCLHQHAKKNARDPLQTYVSELQWDGVSRLDDWMPHYLGAEDTPVNRWIGKTLCCAMVARALYPGCQCRYVIILEGPENAGKSRACAILGNPWHDAITSGFDHKETIIAMRGTWVLEIEELNAMRKSEESAVKAFVTRVKDRVVLKYANEPTVYERRTVLIGTVNPQTDGYLRGLTSDEDTRYLPVRVGAHINLEHLEASRDQLFAEARHCIEGGYQWWEDGEVHSSLAEQREERQSDNPYHVPINTWLTTRSHERDSLEYLSMAEIFEKCLEIPKALWEKKTLQMEVARVLRKLGWERRLTRIDGKLTRLWFLPTPSLPLPPF